MTSARCAHTDDLIRQWKRMPLARQGRFTLKRDLGSA